MKHIAIDPDKIRESLRTHSFGRSIHAFGTITSTNEFARTIAQQGAVEGTLVISEEQTAGKGRLQRKWHSQYGKGLWFSIVLRPSIKSSSVVHFPYLTSVSIAQALEKTLSLSPELKWPNDLLINSKKFCGVLSEIEFHKNEINFIIIGIGINVMQDVTDFSSQTLTNATSLYIELHRYIDRVNLLSEILFHFEKNYIHIIENGFSSILEEWQIRCPFIGRKIKITRDGKTLNGIFRRLDNSGSLILELDDKSEMKIFAGDFNL